MEETWKHFVATGKVEDYLKFKEHELLLNESSDTCCPLAKNDDSGVGLYFAEQICTQNPTVTGTE